MELEFQMFGVEELEEAFKVLPEVMQKRVINTALRGAASIVQRSARANLRGNNSVRTGLLVRSISIKLKRYSATGTVWAGVGPDRSIVGTTPEGRRIVPANYAHLIEGGTRRVPPKPFLRPAVDQNFNAALSEFTKRARKGMAREIVKLRRATSKGGAL